MELCRPTLTLSRTVISVNKRIFWKVRAIPSLLTLYTGILLDVDAVDQHGAAGGLIDAGEQIKNGGLARAVGADQAGNFGGADGEC